MKKNIFFTVPSLALLLLCSCHQNTQVISIEEHEIKSSGINDSNTPLHLLKPNYKTPYVIPTTEGVKKKIDAICSYLTNSMPAKVINKNKGLELKDHTSLPDSAQLKEGSFRLTTYECGVTYAGMLAAAKITNDFIFSKFVTTRLGLIADIAPHFTTTLKDNFSFDTQMRRVVYPSALDDAGAMCTAFIRLQLSPDRSPKFEPIIDHYIDYIMNQQYRLADGTFARCRPYTNTVWLDDMYMGIPALAWYGKYKNDPQYFDEAVKQIKLFKSHMWVEQKSLFRHGWVESMSDHPSFHWGRANGWAMLALCEVLDALPENYKERNVVLDLLKQHIASVASYQEADGFWNQLLDRNDTFFETSCTAIFTYCIAHAINKGWVDAQTYGPVALLGWNAVSTEITKEGQVLGTCVGTGMGFDAAFYSYRPINAMAAHGYGVSIWAGAEIINLLKKQHPKFNDSAIQFYKSEQNTEEPIFSEDSKNTEIF